MNLFTLQNSAVITRFRRGCVTGAESLKALCGMVLQPQGEAPALPTPVGKFSLASWGSGLGPGFCGVL